LLARIPAAVRFVSYEPALGPLTLKASNGVLPDWVIVGGKSGSKARPCTQLGCARYVINAPS
jgi:protein gp37